MNSRPWLPPAALIGSQVAFGASWVLLGALAARGILTFSLPALAWVHLVALGWLSLTALAILFHIIPGFLETEIRAEGFARGMLWVFMAGVVLLVAGFWGPHLVWIAWGAVAVAAGLAGVTVPMVTTVVGYAIAQRVTRATRSGAPSGAPFVVALLAVLIALALAAGIGVAMAGSLGGWWSATFLALASVHAHLAAGGWLTLLVMGVSMRTLIRITGVRPDRPFLHVAGSAGFLVGIMVLVSGLATRTHLVAFAGTLTCGLAALVYVVDASWMLLRSRDPQLPVQAFLGCALGYLLVTITLGLWVLAGHPGLAPAYAYIGLIGWLGQMVTGHIHRIGVRFLLTQTRGENDETEPVEVLSRQLSWATWAASQTAVILGTAGLIFGAAPMVEVAAAAGLLGWTAQTLNFVGAARTA